MSGDHNQYQKDKSYLDFECPRCGHCCQQEHMTIIDKGCYERGCACYDDRVDKDGVAVVARQWQGLTEREVEECTIAAERDYERYMHATRGQQLGQRDQLDWWIARAVEDKLKEKNT